MTKKDLVLAVATANPYMSRKNVEEAVQIIFDMISFYLAHHQRIELRGFGVFSVRHRPGHKAHNPRTGETLWVPDKSVPFFKPSITVRDALKSAKMGKGERKTAFSFLSQLTRAVREMI